MTIYTNLKDYIENKKISKNDISRLTDISLDDLNLSLEGKRNLSFDEFEKILIVIEEKADRFIKSTSMGDKNEKSNSK